FGVEDGLVSDDEERAFLWMNFQNGGVHLIGFEADEFGDGVGGNVEGADDGGFLRGAGALALLSHQFLEARHVDFEATLGAEEFCEIDWETKGVVEFEGCISTEDTW